MRHTGRDTDQRPTQNRRCWHAAAVALQLRRPETAMAAIWGQHRNILYVRGAASTFPLIYWADDLRKQLHTVVLTQISKMGFSRTSVQGAVDNCRQQFITCFCVDMRKRSHKTLQLLSFPAHSCSLVPPGWLSVCGCSPAAGQACQSASPAPPEQQHAVPAGTSSVDGG